MNDVEGLRVRVALHRARRGALDGELDEAIRLLDELDETTELGAAGNDLRARIHAQRGEFADADRCWQRVLALAPGDEAATEGRRVIAAIVEGRRRARPVVTAGRAGVVASVLACAVLAGGVTWLASGDVDDGQQTTIALREQTQRAGSLERRLSSAEAERAEAAQRRERTLDGIAAGLDMPGVIVQRRTDDVRVRFDDGLFAPDGTVVTASGGALLAELGRRLAAEDVATTVVGHTVVVPGGPSAGGSTVALDRAQSATEHLAEGGGLPLTSFSVVSGDQAEAPFPDDDRNRTVTLLLEPSE